MPGEDDEVPLHKDTAPIPSIRNVWCGRSLCKGSWQGSTTRGRHVRSQLYGELLITYLLLGYCKKVRCLVEC